MALLDAFEDHDDLRRLAAQPLIESPRALLVGLLQRTKLTMEQAEAVSGSPWSKVCDAVYRAVRALIALVYNADAIVAERERRRIVDGALRTFFPASVRSRVVFAPIPRGALRKAFRDALEHLAAAHTDAALSAPPKEDFPGGVWFAYLKAAPHSEAYFDDEHSDDWFLHTRRQLGAMLDELQLDMEPGRVFAARKWLEHPTFDFRDAFVTGGERNAWRALLGGDGGPMLAEHSMGHVAMAVAREFIERARLPLPMHAPWRFARMQRRLEHGAVRKRADLVEFATMMLSLTQAVHGDAGRRANDAAMDMARHLRNAALRAVSAHQRQSLLRVADAYLGDINTVPLRAAAHNCAQYLESDTAREAALDAVGARGADEAVNVVETSLDSPMRGTIGKAAYVPYGLGADGDDAGAWATPLDARRPHNSDATSPEFRRGDFFAIHRGNFYALELRAQVAHDAKLRVSHDDVVKEAEGRTTLEFYQRWARRHLAADGNALMLAVPFTVTHYDLVTASAGDVQRGALDGFETQLVQPSTLAPELRVYVAHNERDGSCFCIVRRGNAAVFFVNGPHPRKRVVQVARHLCSALGVNKDQCHQFIMSDDDYLGAIDWTPPHGLVRAASVCWAAEIALRTAGMHLSMSPAASLDDPQTVFDTVRSMSTHWIKGTVPVWSVDFFGDAVLYVVYEYTEMILSLV